MTTARLHTYPLPTCILLCNEYWETRETVPPFSGKTCLIIAEGLKAPGEGNSPWFSTSSC